LLHLLPSICITAFSKIADKKLKLLEIYLYSPLGMLFVYRIKQSIYMTSPVSLGWAA
jgi:hypothetical protein